MQRKLYVCFEWFTIMVTTITAAYLGAKLAEAIIHWFVSI